MAGALPLEKTNRIAGPALFALLLGTFITAVAYGVLLPILPILIQKLAAVNDQKALARHTGLLTGLYTLALFIFAPIWGRISDHYGRRPVLLIGLCGFASSTLIFAFANTVALLYLERFLSGLFSAAIAPVAAAAIGDAAPNDQWRARRLAWLSMAGIGGFLLGPMFGGLAAQLSNNGALSIAGRSLTAPFLLTSGLAYLSAVAVTLTLPRRHLDTSLSSSNLATLRPNGHAIRLLLALAFAVSAGVGVFEVGLSLRSSQTLGMDPARITLMFTECSLVMFIAQAIVFSPLVKAETTRWLIAPALLIMAAGLALVPRTTDPTVLLFAVAAVAVGGGILSPVITYWLSLEAGHAQGAELGKQTAAASLGQAIGSAAGGLLFNLSAFRGASFTIMAGVLMLSVLIALRAVRQLSVAPAQS